MSATTSSFIPCTWCTSADHSASTSRTYKPMVLVCYVLIKYNSILQTKLSHREGHEARRVGEETMPLDQHIEGGHGEREAGVEILPASVHDFLKVAHDGQHRQD